MKRYLKNITVSALAAASLSFSSCIKETFPTNGATAGQVAQSTTALQAMVNAIPTQLVLYGQNYAQAWDFGYPAINVSLTSMTGDMVVAGNSGYDWFANWMTNVALSEDYVTGYQFWYNYYSWIKSCNDVISTLSAVAEEDMNDEQKAYLGIALAFRAQFYLDLVRLFEAKECTGSQVKNYTIPENIKGLACCIVTENTTEEQSKSNPRATVDEVYDQVIFPDLERAERMLADYTRTVKTMPDLSVVYGISARAWLERGSAGVDGAFAKAAEYARKAIDQSNYTPLTQEQWEDPTTGFNSANLQLSLDVVYLPDLRTGSQPLFLHGSHVGRGTVDELWRQGRGARYQLEALCADQRRRLPQALVARSRAVRLLRVQELPSGLQGVLRPQLRGVDQIARLARCHQVPSRTGQLYDLYGG